MLIPRNYKELSLRAKKCSINRFFSEREKIKGHKYSNVRKRSCAMRKLRYKKEMFIIKITLESQM